MTTEHDDDAVCCGTDAACVFTKALLARQGRCGLACRQAVGEADLVRCTDPAAQARCQRWLDALRQRAGFALKLRPGVPLRHAQALQLQNGGLAALREALPTQEPGPPDVVDLLQRAEHRWPALDDAPWPALVAATAAWAPRARRRPR